MKLTFSRTTTLALVIAFCLGVMQFSMAETAVDVSEPRDMTMDDRVDHSIHIEFCVS